MREFVVVGLGRFGSSLARELVDLGHSVLAIDSSEAKVQEISEVVSHAVYADATDEDALKALGIRNFEVAVVSIGEDIQASILATLILKEMGVKMVVVKAISVLHAKVLEKIGADRIIFPEREMGVKVAHSLAAPNVLDYMSLDKDYGIEEVAIPERFIGKSLLDLNLRSKYGITVIAIKRNNELIHSPGAETNFESNDTAVIVGTRKGLKGFGDKG